MQTQTYEVVFSRYNPTKGRANTHEMIEAAGFDDAVHQAKVFLRGLKSMNKSFEFSIERVSIINLSSDELWSE